MIFQLKFQSNQQEQLFQKERFIDLLNQRRALLLLGVVLYPLFFLLDIQMIHQRSLLTLFLIIRVVVALSGGIAITTSFHPKTQKYFTSIIKIILPLSGAGIIAMIASTDGLTSLAYSSGLILVLIFIYTHALSFKYEFLLGWSLITGYNLSILTTKEALTIPLLYNFFLFAVNIIGLFFAYYIERKSRDNFLLNHHLSEAYDEIKNLALTDTLTGAKNRRYFQEVISEDLEKISLLHRQNFLERREVKEHYYGLLMLDIDHFKQVNDTLGHDAGDQVLKQFTRLVKDAIRHDDIIIRWGGEEFLVILKNMQFLHLNTVALKIKKSIETHDFIYNNRGDFIKKTASIGAVPFPLNNLSLEKAIKVADYALYRAKESGRNRITTLSSDTTEPFNSSNIEQLINDKRLKFDTII